MCSQLGKSAPKLSGLTKMARAGLQTWHELRQTHRDGLLASVGPCGTGRPRPGCRQQLMFANQLFRLFRFCKMPACFGSDQHLKIDFMKPFSTELRFCWKYCDLWAILVSYAVSPAVRILWKYKGQTLKNNCHQDGLVLSVQCTRDLWDFFSS